MSRTLSWLCRGIKCHFEVVLGQWGGRLTREPDRPVVRDDGGLVLDLATTNLRAARRGGPGNAIGDECTYRLG